MAFNRDQNRGGGRGGFKPRPSFGKPRFGDRGRDRGNRGPVEMHDAICDNCGKGCQVPFRPTSGKPVYCSDCFENKGDSRKSEDSPRFSPRGEAGAGEAGRQMFDAVCSDCGNACKVPFRPSGDKPVFCSNCFGEKKNAQESTGGQRVNLDEINAKLDKIIDLLSPVKTQKPEKKTKSVKETAPEEALETSN